MTNPQFFTTPGYGDTQFRDYYSQAVRVGDRIETSGQGGWDADWNFPLAIEDEIAQAFDNVGRALAAAGASWSDVIQVNSYHVHVAGDSFGESHLSVMVQEFRRRMGQRAPIWTAVGVTVLGDPRMRIEIRVTAVVNQD